MGHLHQANASPTIGTTFAVVAALATPLVTGKWKLRSGGWHPLLAAERYEIAKMAAETNNCTHFSPQNTELRKTICTAAP